MKFSLAALLLLSVVCLVLAIPPDDFGFPTATNETGLTVAFQTNGNTTSVEGGELFGVDITSQEPMLAVNTDLYESLASYSGQYVVLMVDPDARYPNDPKERFYLHLGGANYTKTQSAPSRLGISGFELTNSTPPFVPYTQPAPPDNSSAHRYLIYAFQQPDNFAVPSAFSSFNADNRGGFNLTDFISQASLNSSAAAANWFYVSNETDVSSTFIASPGGTYPGGNGDMITSGTGTVVTSTATATSGTATSVVTSTTTGTASGSSASGSASGSGGSTASGSASGASASASHSSSGSSGAAAPIATAMSGLLGVGVGIAALL